MTDINFDTVELKNAEITAVVGEKQISAKIEDKAAAEKTQNEAPFDVLPA